MREVIHDQKKKEHKYGFLYPLIGLGMASVAVFLLTFLTVSPYKDDASWIWQNIAIFIFTLFLSLYCFISIVLFVIKNILLRPFDKKLIFKVSQRQGFLLALGVVGLAILSLTKTVNIFTGILLGAVLLAVEAVLR